MFGQDLFNVVVENTGLNKDTISTELHQILEKNNISPENMTLEDLRMALADYLQDVLLSCKE